MAPGPAGQLRRAGRTEILSRAQFARLRPSGKYGDYLEFVAGKRGTTVEALRVYAPRTGRQGFQQVVRARIRRLESFFAGGKGYRVEMDWLDGEVPPNVPDGVRALIAEAKRWLGDPYVWGGGHGADLSRTVQTAAKGGKRAAAFDCSGFTRYLYAKTFGIDIGTYTGTQRHAGRSVRQGEPLEPGDLVFFGQDYGHMGLYVGDGLFVHAPRTGDVIKISRMKDRADFVEARRIVDRQARQAA